MTPPYRSGEKLAWLDPVPDGILVQRAVVQGIEPAGDGVRWRVVTDRGTALVDAAGNAGRIVPLDASVEREFDLHGGSDFVVHPTLTDMARDLDRVLDHDQERSLDLGDDLGFD